MAQRIRLQWDFRDFAPAITPAEALALGYDKVVVEKALVEITPVTGRMPVVDEFLLYAWHDPSGELTSSYRIRLLNSETGLLHPTSILPSASITLSTAHYCTVDDIRDEGYANPPWTDALIEKGITRATAYINRFCGQYFEPRWRTLIVDGVRLDQFLCEAPIVAIAQVLVDGESQDIPDMKIYNRHLTHGMESPDDRNNPRVAYALESDYFDRSLRSGFSQKFLTGRKNIKLVGMFGYTGLGDNDFIGETAEDSQFPLSLGQTPELIKRAAVLLTVKLMQTIASGGGSSSLTVIEEETKDQRVKYQGPSAASAASEGLFGEEFDLGEVDAILAGFVAPISIGGV